MDAIEKVWHRFIEGWQLKSVVSLVFTYLFGEYNAAMGALLVLWLLDWASKWYALSRQAGGFKVAWQTDVISSYGMREGMHKTIWYMVFLIVAKQLEQFSILGFTLGKSPTEAAAAYLALIEAKSILENLRDAGWENSGPLLAILGKKQEQVAGQVFNVQQSGLVLPQQPINSNKNSTGGVSKT